MERNESQEEGSERAPGRILYSDRARETLGIVPGATRAGIDQRLDYVRRMPRMYAVTSDDRFPGCRTFWVDPCYRVFYMVAAGADDVYVLAIAEEEVDGPGEEY